ncbi:alpha-1,4-glucan--maltose-1-phosphate maltosyltransferase [Hoeflea ulvae]|uniref:Alpha-1,4-glucan:maltose-1-phosphate maltosyltransferase n=1 Tax=Hoeflea ulvae TaxID=2983764 RepID=A0ABT3YMI2_9HYPH|nr:alpha-1,4-glucan--maltose-1-phosphate maltosyltransferase [Hoeflea ulvae]MCY0096930.1 alpha-1,4-glucan--maltose-1-phosphate maltosyltransferase [Hoeflea ulvae]
MASALSPILLLRTEEAASVGADMIDHARAAGMTGVLWRADWLMDAPEMATLIKDVRAAGLAPMVEIDIADFPVHHELVAEFPQLFSIRRSGQSEAPIDPRKPMPAAGRAIARLHLNEAVEFLARPVCERLISTAANGIEGFRLANPHRLGSRFLQLVRKQLEPHGVMILAGPAPASDGAASAAGLDRQIVAFSLPDLKEGRVSDRIGTGAATAPVLGELDIDQLAGDLDARGMEALVLTAAAVFSGLIIPESFLGGGDDARALVVKAAGLAQRAAPYDGTVQLLARTRDNVVALARTRNGDARAHDGALLVLVNGDAEERPAPGRGALVQRTGTALDLGPADLSPLLPGEVRIIELAPSRTIIADAPALDVDCGAAMPRLVAEIRSPRVDGGDFAVKRVVGDDVEVTAAVFADGHEQLAVELHWRSLDSTSWQSVRMEEVGKNDLWTGRFTLDRLGPYEFFVEAWLDRFGGFRRDLVKKRDAGVAQLVDLADGKVLIGEAVARSGGEAGQELSAFLRRFDTAADSEASADVLLDDDLAQKMTAVDDRPFRIVTDPQRVDSERLAARFSSWYELFPRSMTTDKARHGRLEDVIPHLARIRDMGFDTVYFPPIHPIGKTNRKGPNNTLTPEPHDVGSPYAIGSPDGGHDAIHPELGSFEDFDRLVVAARDHGLEVALDFAIQASPDHPWLEDHPGWFSWRSDGSMKYAENPPKKYQDIVNLDFYGPDAVPDLWLALRDVVLLWISHGVKTFRVDNPHTKPLPFWEWMIADIRHQHPEVIFLAEAFTRPTMMYRLAKVGFSQSYTYFTWRDGKHELIDYITELTDTAPKEFYRPHFFVNTPDINPMFLQSSGRPGFRIRAVLAATLSGLFGVYSGFELCESAALPGREEYLDSEKYEIRPRDHTAAGNVIADITLLNRLRRLHPALQTHLNTRFYLAHNDNIIWYGKASPDGDELIMVMVNLDPHHAQECHFEVPLWEFGLPDTAGISVEDLVLGHRFDWHGKIQWIRITPDLPYRIWRLRAPGGLA